MTFRLVGRAIPTGKMLTESTFWTAIARASTSTLASHAAGAPRTGKAFALSTSVVFSSTCTNAFAIAAGTANDGTRPAALLNRAGALHAQIRRQHVLVDVVVEVDRVGFGRFDQHRRVRGANHAEVLLVHLY